VRGSLVKSAAEEDTVMSTCSSPVLFARLPIVKMLDKKKKKKVQIDSRQSWVGVLLGPALLCVTIAHNTPRHWHAMMSLHIIVCGVPCAFFLFALATLCNFTFRSKNNERLTPFV
jgi:hypothetical protein